MSKNPKCLDKALLNYNCMKTFSFAFFQGRALLREFGSFLFFACFYYGCRLWNSVRSSSYVLDRLFTPPQPIVILEDKIKIALLQMITEESTAHVAGGQGVPSPQPQPILGGGDTFFSQKHESWFTPDSKRPGVVWDLFDNVLGRSSFASGNLTAKTSSAIFPQVVTRVREIGASHDLILKWDWLGYWDNRAGDRT